MPDDSNALPPARFPLQLGLPPGDPQQLSDAAKVVRQEYRDGSRRKRLNCRRVSVFAERDRGAVYVVDVGRSVEFDWTWEGARAFGYETFDDRQNIILPPDSISNCDDGVLWSGEIVEVDERNGCLFISLDDPEMAPTLGAFVVQPFEFLAGLDAVYNGDEFEAVRAALPARLRATAGHTHPVIENRLDVGLPALQDWWAHSWSVLWGPPGTGKTWTTGQQISRVLDDPSERILVVSTTNKATDAVALAIGRAAQEHRPEKLADATIRRVGKGVQRQAFVAASLESLLQDTESENLLQIDSLAQQLPRLDSWDEKAFTRKRIGELRAGLHDQSSRVFVDPQTRVVVATAFKAMSNLNGEMIRKMIAENHAPFTTIFIDEAGLISRSVVAALSLLAARRVVLVGDSKQLAPISRISRILPTRQQTWLASSGLSHLDAIDRTPTAVHVLSQQHRMHPEVCRVVSAFQYDGFLTTAAQRAARPSNLPAFIADVSRAIWYVLDEEDAQLASIRAARGPGNRSWVRTVTQNVLQKLFTNPDLRAANGLFISPFRGQAQVIGDLLASWELKSWEASTVHSQQGSEADIVIFDTVNASSYTWPHDEWKRLINVALSRAKEAIIVLASRSEMEEPYLRALAPHLTATCLVAGDDRVQWQSVSSQSRLAASRVGEPTRPYHATSSASAKMGDQMNARKSMTPILSQEQQSLTNLKLDGKPRLVRGVAGSGKSVVLCNWLAKTAKRLEHQQDVRIWAVYANRSLHKLLRDSVETAWQGLDHGELFGRPEFPWSIVDLLHVKDILAGILPLAELSLESYGFDYDRAAEEFLHCHDGDELLPRCSALFIDEAQDMGPSVLRLLLSIVEQSNAEDVNSRAAHIFFDNAQNVYATKTPKWSDFGLDMRGRSTIMRESFRSTTPITELAVNVLDRLSGNKQRKDQRELISLGLLERTIRGGEDWLNVRFNEIDGPKPIYHGYETRGQEMSAVARHLQHLIVVDGISPTDICIIYNGRADEALENQLAPKLAELGVELSIQKNRSFERHANTLIATTAQSIKGYEAEVVIIPCVDKYVGIEGRLLEHSLYVAMTRARSLLAVYGVDGGSSASRRITQAIRACVAIQGMPDS